VLQGIPSAAYTAPACYTDKVVLLCRACAAIVVFGLEFADKGALPGITG
jgi:hypothetical protein